MGYESIRSRIVKRVPQSSLVGMLFETDDIYEVIKSTGIGVGQHDPYTWVVKDIDLEHLKSLKKSAVIVSGALRQWLSGMDMKDRERFIDIVFGVADACDSSDLVTMGLTPVKSIRQMMDGYDGMDTGEKEFFRTVLGALIKDTGKQTRNEVHSEWSDFVESVDKWIESKQKKLGMIEARNRRSGENGTDS
ncbi:MAG: DUF2974 domain-containing protein [Lachnospiraceae bacterium]|nr:DUF2974 domain-containing protein [Lachnospiraceae bacterium]